MIDQRDVNEIVGVLRHGVSPDLMSPMASYVYNHIRDANLTAEEIGL